jgi:hypothetical protein
MWEPEGQSQGKSGMGNEVVSAWYGIDKIDEERKVGWSGE